MYTTAIDSIIQKIYTRIWNYAWRHSDNFNKFFLSEQQKTNERTKFMYFFRQKKLLIWKFRSHNFIFSFFLVLLCFTLTSKLKGEKFRAHEKSTEHGVAQNATCLSSERFHSEVMRFKRKEKFFVSFVCWFGW